MTEIKADSDSRSRLRVILAASIGSALEWYDFFLYGTAAALVFGELFFPKSDPVVGTLLAFLTFGVGFAVRPLGGILFGILGDRLRAQTRIGGNAADDRRRHHADRRAADLFADRHLGADTAGGDARRAGSGRRRRIWRRGDLSGRERATEASRLLGQLCAARRLRRQSARRRRLCAGDDAAARGPDDVGLAHSVPRKLPADPGRHLCPPADHGNARLHRGGGGARQGRAQSGDGSAQAPSAQLSGRARRAPWRERARLSLPGVRPQLLHHHTGHTESRCA